MKLYGADDDTCAAHGCEEGLSAHNRYGLCYRHRCLYEKNGLNVPIRPEREAETAAPGVMAQRGQQIAAYLEARGERVTAAEIAEALGFKKSDIYNALVLLVRDGHAEKLSQKEGGGYRFLGRDLADKNLAEEVTSPVECEEPVDNIGDGLTPVAALACDTAQDAAAESQSGAPECDTEPESWSTGHSLPPFAGVPGTLEVRTSGDLEVDAIAGCVELLTAVDAPACRRVLWYLTDRFGP